MSAPEVSPSLSPSPPPPLVPPPFKPRVWTVFLVTAACVGLATVAYMYVIAGLMVWYIFEGKDLTSIEEGLPGEVSVPTTFVLVAAASQLAIFASAIIPAILSPVPFRERLGLVPAQGSWTIYPLAMFGAMFPQAIGVGLAYLLAIPFPTDISGGPLFNEISPAMSVPFVLFISLVPAIGEELLFRGYIQRRLLERWSPALAIGIASTIFALFHVMPHWVVSIFPLGIWLGVVAWRSGSIYPGMLCHAFANAAITTWRLTVRFAEVPMGIQAVIVSLAVLLGAVCFFKLLYDFQARPLETADFPGVGTTA